jgi:hypothetical protein
MKYPHQNYLSFPKQQRGIATILLVVLVGVALTATALGVMHSLRSTQEKQVAVHAVTHAQNGLWTAVEAVRMYLASLTPAQIDQLQGKTEMGLSFPSNTGLGSFKAKNIVVSGSGPTRKVNATLVNNHGDAKASAAVEVTFEMREATVASYQLTAPLNFNDDVKFTSRLTFDNPMSINVKGNVELTGDVTNLNGINATGLVSITSGADVGVIHSNSDVTLSGDTATATEIKAQGNVTITGTAGVPLISANGNVTHNAGTNTTSLRSRANVTVGNSSGSHSLIIAGGGVTANASYGGTVTNLWSVNTIVNNSATAQLSNVYGQANLNCPGTWNKFTTIAINGTFGSGCTSPLTPTSGQTVTRPAAVTVNVMNPVPPFNMPSLAVDVYPLREEANYIVSYEAGKIKVMVNNVNGLANGTYYVGNNRDICTAVDASGNCTVPTTKYMCLGGWPEGPCLSYSYKGFTVAENTDGTIVDQTLPAGTPHWKGTFTIEGGGFAPGIWWIDGNLIMKTGYNNGTLLVTGNIASWDQYRGAAVNYGGEPIVYSSTVRDPTKRTTPYQEICQAIGTGMKEGTPHLIQYYTPRFQNQYPTNLCNKTTGTYTPHRLGNIALAAGGTRTAALGGDGTTYSGGDISIKANSNVFGIVLAGGYFVARNNVAIMGSVSAAVQGAKRTGTLKNLSDGDVKIYTDSATEFYSPNKVPWMGATPCTVGCGTPTAPASAKLLWSRYL